MRTFYIFKINKEYYKLTKNIPYNLYLAYLNIKMATKNNIDYIYNEYFTFTEIIQKTPFNKYLFNKLNHLDGYKVYDNIHQYRDYYTDEESKLKVFNSYMILKTNKNDSIFLKELLRMPELFVIDFEKEDYFYLSKLKYILVN